MREDLGWELLQIDPKLLAQETTGNLPLSRNLAVPSRVVLAGKVKFAGTRRSRGYVLQRAKSELILEISIFILILFFTSFSKNFHLFSSWETSV
jgi:hypothetical protein